MDRTQYEAEVTKLYEKAIETGDLALAYNILLDKFQDITVSKEDDDWVPCDPLKIGHEIISPAGRRWIYKGDGSS